MIRNAIRRIVQASEQNTLPAVMSATPLLLGSTITLRVYKELPEWISQYLPPAEIEQRLTDEIEEGFA